MSVFTPLERHDLETFLADYSLGRLRDYKGIAEGSENTNFFVSLEGGECVLTLVERGPAADLPFFIDLLDVLHDADLPVPYAIRDRSDRALRELKDKPALLQPRLAGKHIREPNPHHCAEVGALMGRIHLATRERIIERKSDRGLDWMLAEGPAQVAQLVTDEQLVLNTALAEIAEHKDAIRRLPRANLHADLFRDNVMFDGPQLSGVIDFYNACSGPMLYDLAIAFNDWCSDEEGAVDVARGKAFLAGYAAQRRLTASEAALWPVMLRVACVRFWLSRAIAAQAFAGQDVLIHDPREFQRRLAHRQGVTLDLPIAL